MTKGQILTKYGKYGEVIYEFYKLWRVTGNGYLVVEQETTTKELVVGWYYNLHDWTPNYEILTRLPFTMVSGFYGEWLWKKLGNMEKRLEYIYHVMIRGESSDDWEYILIYKEKE